MQEHLYKCIVFLFLNYSKKQMSFNHLYLIEQHLLSLRRSAILPVGVSAEELRLWNPSAKWKCFSRF